MTLFNTVKPLISDKANELVEALGPEKFYEAIDRAKRSPGGSGTVMINGKKYRIETARSRNFRNKKKKIKK